MTNQNTPALLQKDITDQVNGKLVALKNEGLHLPPGYASANALKSAFFELQEVQDRNKKPALDVCTKESIANTLLDMVVQGLSPAKKQCYFIVYGNKLQLNRSYFGTQAVLKRLSNVKDIWANVIYKGDTFDIEIVNGRETLKEHKTAFENRDNEIIGAYCIIEKTDGERVLTTMTKKEIDKSWSKAKTKNVQNDFPQEMAKRTVINRAAKAFVNTSDDSDLLIEAINNTTANEYQDDTERKEAEIIDEIDQNANSEVLDPKPVDVIDEPQVSGEVEEPPFIEPEPQEDADPYA